MSRKIGLETLELSPLIGAVIVIDLGIEANVILNEAVFFKNIKTADKLIHFTLFMSRQLRTIFFYNLVFNDRHRPLRY